jgi:hypothetical protein
MKESNPCKNPGLETSTRSTTDALYFGRKIVELVVCDGRTAANKGLPAVI